VNAESTKTGHETTNQTHVQMFSNVVGGRASGNESTKKPKQAPARVTQNATARNLPTLNVGDVVMWSNEKS